MQATRLEGRWRACGLREGLDMRRADGRLSYYPVGRGGVALLPGGAFRVTAVNGCGVFSRDGTWAWEDGLLRVRLGDDAGVYACRMEGERLRLEPERGFYRCARRLLHAPAFERDGE